MVNKHHYLQTVLKKRKIQDYVHRGILFTWEIFLRSKSISCSYVLGTNISPYTINEIQIREKCDFLNAHIVECNEVQNVKIEVCTMIGWRFRPVIWSNVNTSLYNNTRNLDGYIPNIWEIINLLLTIWYIVTKYCSYVFLICIFIYI